MARPRRALGTTARLEIRLTEREKAFIAEQAHRGALTLSEYVRRRALGIRVISHVDDHLINELRRLGGLQKLLAGQIESRKDEYEQIRNEIIAAIKRV